MVLYENEPDEFNLNFLREELSIDPEFGLENIAHETGMWIREHPDITGLVHIYERVWRNHEV
jgi:hypothetical protein